MPSIASAGAPAQSRCHPHSEPINEDRRSVRRQNQKPPSMPVYVGPEIVTMIVSGSGTPMPGTTQAKPAADGATLLAHRAAEPAAGLDRARHRAPLGNRVAATLGETADARLERRGSHLTKPQASHQLLTRIVVDGCAQTGHPCLRKSSPCGAQSTFELAQKAKAGLARSREHGAACDAEIADPADPAVEIDAPRFGSTCMRLVPCVMLTTTDRRWPAGIRSRIGEVVVSCANVATGTEWPDADEYQGRRP
jgi:hypothetical protein